MSFQKQQTTKILINALSARQGGGQTYLINLLERFPADLSAEVYVLAPESLALPSNGSNIKRISVQWPVANPFGRVIWEKLHLAKLASRLGATVLFCPGGIVGTRPPRGCKSVTMFRNMIPFNSTVRRRYRLGYMKFRNFLLRRSLLESMAHADLVIFLSDYARGVIEREVRGKLGNAVTIPHGIAPVFRQKATTNPAPYVKQWPDGYFLYVSTLDYYKAQLEVVRAYALLKQQRPTREKLILAGPEYREYGRLVRQEIKKLALENDVVITGALSYSDMPGLYRNAVLNIFASECENCPNILIEALACGRPVFSSNYPPMPEFAGEAPVYFDPKSPRDLAEKLATALADPSRMKDLAERAQKQSQNYDWDVSAHATWRLIHQMAQS